MPFALLAHCLRFAEKLSIAMQGGAAVQMVYSKCDLALYQFGEPIHRNLHLFYLNTHFMGKTGRFFGIAGILAGHLSHIFKCFPNLLDALGLLSRIFRNIWSCK